MATIQLTQGYEAIVDDDRFDEINAFKWHVLLMQGGRIKYAARRFRINDASVVVYMHRFVIGAPKGSDVDHRNRNGLDNRAENLRFCSRSQNTINRVLPPSLTGYRGVSKTQSGKFNARIWMGGSSQLVGKFLSAREAALAYDNAARRIHGEFAVLNFPDVS